MREESRNEVYIIKRINNKVFKRHVLSPEFAGFYPHLSPFWDNAKVVPEGTLDDVTLSAWVRVPLTEDPVTWRIYEVNADLTRHWITCADPDFCGTTWIANGGDPDGVYTVNNREMNSYTLGPNVFVRYEVAPPSVNNPPAEVQEVTKSEVEVYPRLYLVRVAGKEKVYYITEGGLKKWIQNIDIFNSYNNKWEDVTIVSSTVLAQYEDVSLIKLSGTKKVYKLEGSVKRHIKTVDAFNSLGLDWNNIAPVNEVEFSFYEEGDAIE